MLGVVKLKGQNMENNTIQIINTKNSEDIMLVEKQLEHPILSYDSVKNDIQDNTYTFSIITCNKEVAGYINYANCIDHTDLISIAIIPKYRRLGFAKELMMHMEKSSIFPILLEVRESNSSAIKLYESLNYTSINIRKNYYTNPVENAVIYIKETPTN